MWIRELAWSMGMEDPGGGKKKEKTPNQTANPGDLVATKDQKTWVAATPSEEGSVDPKRHQQIPNERRGLGSSSSQSSSSSQGPLGWGRTGSEVGEQVDPRGL